MNEYSVIGKSFPRKEGLLKATGTAQYTTDMVLPGMLFGKILRSPYAHARILNIDTSKARKLKGVRAVITAKETGGCAFCHVDIPMKHPANKSPLAVDRVRFIGDEIAAVAAINEDIAEEALELIKVEYEELPAVFETKDAMQPGAPRIHDYAEGNIGWSQDYCFGDVEKNMEKSDFIREDKFFLPAVAHCALEPHCCLAKFDINGRLTLWSSTQSVHYVRLGLTKILNMREGDIRVIKPYVGGAFGGKHEMMDLEPICAFLSRAAGLPVKLALSREEVFMATRLRHRVIFNLRTGYMKDGTLMAIDGKSIWDAGAYNSMGVIANKLSAMHFSLSYQIPAVRYETHRVFTNNPIPGAMRGFGAPQTNFAVESQLEFIAKDLGMEPTELLKKNAIKPNCTTHGSLVINSCGLTECIDQAKEISQWKSKRGKMSGSRGLGMGCGSFMSGTMFRERDSEPYAAALIRVNCDGTVNLLVGAADIGQGSDTTLCMIVAEELGVRKDDVHIVSADTEITPIDQGTFASRITTMVGNASIDAASKIKKRLFKAVGEKLEVQPDELVARDRRVFVNGSPEQGVSFAQAVAICQQNRHGKPLVSNGHYDMDKRGYLDTRSGAPFDPPPAFSFCAHTAEVIVDEETGQVKLSEMVPAHDLGMALNPMGAEGQLEGSVQMGLGYALLEEILLDKGKILNPSFLDYEFPTALDMPEIKPVLVETNELEGPFGAKECGEGATTPVAPAITNAICDAVGIRVYKLPFTPDMVLKALEKKGDE